MKAKNESFTLRLDLDLREAIEAAALRDNRTPSSFVYAVLAERIERDQQQAGDRAA